ncbi:MAG: response regulator [Clostridiales bacterium]|nr:response regulator [Clostridiales bacterium]
MEKKDNQVLDNNTSRKDQINPSSKTIMAVDDLDVMLGSLKTIFTEAGYDFIGKKSGQEALKYLDSNEKKPDLFLLDINMPHMEGYELYEKIIKKGITTPVIFLSGNASDKFVRKAAKIGADDFIVKPFDNEVMMNKIKKCLQN